MKTFLYSLLSLSVPLVGLMFAAAAFGAEETPCWEEAAFGAEETPCWEEAAELQWEIVNYERVSAEKAQALVTCAIKEGIA